METSVYLERFKRLKELGGDKYSLIGGKVLVERITPPEMKTAGGLFIPQDVKSHKGTASDFKTEIGVVLLVGSGYIDENGYDVPIDLKPGEIILLPTSVSYYTTFPGLISSIPERTLGMIRESDVWFKFASVEAFEECTKILISIPGSQP
jgi:co-chaperonin GroES (HSP10)